jgi:hypothetical protein
MRLSLREVRDDIGKFGGIVPIRELKFRPVDDDVGGNDVEVFLLSGIGNLD